MPVTLRLTLTLSTVTYKLATPLVIPALIFNLNTNSQYIPVIAV